MRTLPKNPIGKSESFIGISFPLVNDKTCVEIQASPVQREYLSEVRPLGALFFRTKWIKTHFASSFALFEGLPNRPCRLMWSEIKETLSLSGKLFKYSNEVTTVNSGRISRLMTASTLAPICFFRTYTVGLLARATAAAWVAVAQLLLKPNSRRMHFEWNTQLPRPSKKLR